MKITEEMIKVLTLDLRAREDIWKVAFNYYNKAHKSNLRRSQEQNYGLVKEYILNAVDYEKNGTL